jgi:methylated-DNA-[protein]-cysteine S-methyltransferase
VNDLRHPSDDRLLAAAYPPPTPGEMKVRRAGLADRAEGAGLLDVAYRTLDSPYGPLLVAVTATGLVRVAFERDGDEAVLSELAAAVSPRILASHRRTDEVARQLDEYFAGRRRRFDLSLDLRLAAGFRRAVLEELCAIPYGATRSYAAVAAAVGNPKAVRAVGTACARNPVPLVVPCHRVVRSDGTIGNYGGGTDAKVALLALESGR